MIKYTGPTNDNFINGKVYDWTPEGMGEMTVVDETGMHHTLYDDDVEDGRDYRGQVVPWEWYND